MPVSLGTGTQDRGTTEASLDMGGTQYGIGGAVRLGRLDLGGSLKVMELQVQSRIERAKNPINMFFPRYDPVRDQVYMAGIAPDSDFLSLRENIDDTDAQLGYSLGALYRAASWIQIGVSARLNPKFTFKEDLDAIVRSSYDPSSSYTNCRDNVSAPRCGQVFPLARAQAASIRIPNQIGFGVAVFPTSSLTLVADAVWTQLSQVLAESNLTYSTLVEAVCDGDTCTGDFVPLVGDNFNASPLIPNMTPDRFRMEDRIELRTGFEAKFFPGNTRLDVRGGFFVVPQKVLRWTEIEKPATQTEFIASTFNEIIYNSLPEERELGWSGGLGLTIGKFEFAFAYSHSDSLKQAVLSTVFRF